VDAALSTASSSSGSLLPTLLASALFMDLLDTAALGTALPTMARDFGTDPVHLRPALTAYLVTVAILVPASGWVADRFGAQRVFSAAMLLFLAGSVGCSMSSGVGELVASRVLQGVGGAMMTPVARIIVIAATPRERLVGALNAFTFPAVFGPLLGPPLAGVLLSIASWHWIFLINVPIGLASLFALRRIAPKLETSTPGPFDARGFAAAVVLIVALLTLSESAGSQLLSSTVTKSAAAVAVIAGAVLAIHSLRVHDPILELRFLSRRAYRSSIIGGAFGRLGLGAMPFLMPLFLQSGLGWSPLQTGGVVAAQMVGALAARPVGPFAIRRLGFRGAIIGMGLLTAALTAVPALCTDATSVWTMGALLFCIGLARAGYYVAANPIAFNDIAPDEVSRASTLNTVVQQLTLGFGVSLSGFLLLLSSGGETLSLSDFATTFIALGCVTAIAVVPFLSMPANTGAHMRFGDSSHE
jgi:EmrB/QacA subfamily drug resistance transporter